MTKQGESCQIDITGITEEGAGVGHLGGMAVFCPGLLPGEQAEVRLTKVKKSYAIGKMLRLLRTSPDRILPECDSAAQCGGCTFRHMDYSAQLSMKQQRVADCLQRIGGLSPDILPIRGMESPFRYRNKAIYPFTVSAGQVKCGFYAANSHRLIPIVHCLNEDPRAAAVRETVTAFLQQYGISIYDETAHRGLVRHLMVRTASCAEDTMAVLVINGKTLPHCREFIRRLAENCPFVTSVYLNVNQRASNTVLGEEYQLLSGTEYLRDKIGDVCFDISPASFYQVNPLQTKVLYDTVLQFADLRRQAHIWDIYCGIGTIGIYLAAAQQAAGQPVAHLVGIEYHPRAVRDAARNAACNAIMNAEFYAGDAAVLTPALLAGSGTGSRAGSILPCPADTPCPAGGSTPESRRPDLIIVDPPRKGCDPVLIETIVQASPAKLIYVSCNPATLARDLKAFCGNGFQCEKVQPVDMFPWTGHVETIVLLSHKSPDSHINMKVEFREGERKVPLDAIAEQAKKYQPKPKITYKMIQDYVERKYGFIVHTAYIAEVKRSLGLTIYDAPNAVEELKQPRKRPPKEKVEAIKDAIKYYEVI